MKTRIDNVNIVLEDKVLQSSSVLIENNLIVNIGEKLNADKVIDGENCYLVAGFIDIHCHGGDGYDFIDADINGIDKIAKYHLIHGTTTLVATTLSASLSETTSSLENISNYISKNAGSSICGIHMEGPWLNANQCGAQDTKCMIKPDAKMLKQLKKQFPNIIRVSVAPEFDENFEFASMAKKLNIKLAFAHTDSNFSQIEKARENGYNIATHLYSGMKGVVRENSYRIAGAVEASLFYDDIFVELIADARHLPLELLGYVYKIKGSDKICLITDAIRASGLKNGEKSKIGSLENGQDVIVENDVAFLLDRQSFAGSTATTDRLFKNMMKVTNNICEVSKMLSKTPAKVMGFNDRGEIKVNKIADLLLIDKQFNIKTVISKGEII